MTTEDQNLTLEDQAFKSITPIGVDPKTEANLYSSPPTSIKVREDRHRQKFSRKPLDSLIDSMRFVGQLQPGLCHWKGKELELLVGERRLKACIVLQEDFQYIIKDEIEDPILLEQMQLDENLIRENLTWQEEVGAKARLHEILTERYGTAKAGLPGGQRLLDTAEYLGMKISALQEDVTLATFLAIPEVTVAPNKSTAKKIAKRMIEQVKRRKNLQAAFDVVNKRGKEGEEKTSMAPLTEEARAELKLKQREEKPKEGKEPLPEPTVMEKQLIYFSSRCFLDKMEEKLKDFEDKSFDIICFDPPWGVGFDKNKRLSPGTKDYEDSWDKFWLNLEGWLNLLYKKLKEDSHLYMFFAIVAHNFIYDTLEKVGFSTNRMPLIWHKKGAHSTRNPTIWPGRSYEPIAYARKGGKPLVKMGAPDVISTSMPSPALKDIHPSAKHPDIYRELLTRSANPGETILDPMAGSGMFGVAAESLGKTHALNWFQIELDEDYRNLQLLNLTKGYEEITKKEPEVEVLIGKKKEESQSGFENLTPGTPEWGGYFRDNPDQQDAMLAWRVRNKK